MRITSIEFASLGNDFISANTSGGTARFFAQILGQLVEFRPVGESFPNQSR